MSVCLCVLYGGISSISMDLIRKYEKLIGLLLYGLIRMNNVTVYNRHMEKLLYRTTNVTVQTNNEIM